MTYFVLLFNAQFSKSFFKTRDPKDGVIPEPVRAPFLRDDFSLAAPFHTKRRPIWSRQAHRALEQGRPGSRLAGKLLEQKTSPVGIRGPFLRRVACGKQPRGPVQRRHRAVVPGDAFSECGEGYVRISYAASMETLEEGLNRMEQFIHSINEKV